MYGRRSGITSRRCGFSCWLAHGGARARRPPLSPIFTWSLRVVLPQIMSVVSVNAQRVTKTPRMFNTMLGLNVNLTLDEFMVVSDAARADFVGVGNVGISQIVR